MSAAPTPPTRPLIVKITETLQLGTSLWRAHHESRDANAFWPGTPGETRFASIVDSSGIPIPVLYAGDSSECAVFESVFHDLPATGARSADLRRLENRMLTRLELQTSVVLADLTKRGLPSLGMTRTELIESEAIHYQATAAWAEAIHNDNPGIQGLYWISRQNDRVAAAMLFGDRVDPDDVAPSRETYALSHGRGLREVLEKALSADITMR